jgi:hypothetical protein
VPDRRMSTDKFTNYNDRKHSFAIEAGKDVPIAFGRIYKLPLNDDANTVVAVKFERGK